MIVTVLLIVGLIGSIIIGLLGLERLLFIYRIKKICNDDITEDELEDCGLLNVIGGVMVKNSFTVDEVVNYDEYLYESFLSDDVVYSDWEIDVDDWGHVGNKFMKGKMVSSDDGIVVDLSDVDKMFLGTDSVFYDVIPDDMLDYIEGCGYEGDGEEGALFNEKSIHLGDEIIVVGTYLYADFYEKKIVGTPDDAGYGLYVFESQEMIDDMYFKGLVALSLSMLAIPTFGWLLV